MGDGHFPISYEMYATRELETVGGHRLAPLRDVWESKAALQRPKDMQDLNIIARLTGWCLDPHDN